MIVVLWYDGHHTSEPGFDYARSRPDFARCNRGQDRGPGNAAEPSSAGSRGPGQVHPRRAPSMNPVTSTRALARRNSNGLLVLVCLAQYMVILDVSIVNVALPAIRGDLGFSTTGLQWVVNAYTLTFAGFLMLGGRASDLLGRRRGFLGGTALFVLASLT